MRSRLAQVALLGLLAAPLAASPVDLSFKSGTSLAQVAETVSVLGRFNVVVCPGAGDLATAFSARSMEPADALAMVAKANGLAVKKVGAGDTPTYAVGKLDQLRERFQTIATRVFQLHYVSPHEVARQLTAQADPLAGLVFTEDERLRRLAVRGSQEDLRAIEDSVRDIDMPLAQVRLNLALQVGAPGKLETIWRGNQVFEAGQQATFELTAASKPGTNGWRAERLKGAFTVRVNADNYCALQGQLDAGVEGPGGKVSTVITGQTAVRAGTELALGSHQLGDDRALTLTARIEIVGAASADPLMSPPPTPPGVPIGLPGLPPPVPSLPLPNEPMPPGTGPGAPGSGSMPTAIPGHSPVPTAPPSMVPPPAPVPNLDDPDADLEESPGSVIKPSPAASPDPKMDIDPEL